MCYTINKQICYIILVLNLKDIFQKILVHFKLLLKGSTKMHKTMLSVEDLIFHMQNKGISFSIMSQEDAKTYLHKNNNYFKLTSYRKNYPKFTTGVHVGKYENLEFAYLVELARIDVQLRQVILGLCLDIEHFLKVELIRVIEQNPDEDGYSIVLDYLFDKGNGTIADRSKNAAYRSRSISNKLEHNKNNPYCGGLISKYHEEMPIWALVEIISFGDLLRFIEYVSNKLDWPLPVEIKSLDRVRQIRNAAAHNNCIINDLSSVFEPSGKAKCNEPIFITQFVRNSGVNKPSMQKKLSNRRFSQIVHLLHVYDIVVTSENSRQSRLTELKSLVNNRMIENGNFFKTNQLIKSTYDVFNKLVNSLN